MRLPIFIARRYFFSRKNPSAINIISFISMLGYALGAMAIIVLLSVLNGFEKIIFQVYDVYYPDLKIEAKTGKVFAQDSLLMAKIKKTPGVITAVFCLEENAIIKNGDNQAVGTLKGVGAEYPNVVKTDSLIVGGDAVLNGNQGSMGWMAEGLVYKLNVGKAENLVHIMAPQRETVGVTQMDMLEDDLPIAAMVRPGEEMNQKLVIAPLAFAQEMFEREAQVSSIELKITDPKHPGETADKLMDFLPKGLTIKDRREQNEAVYKMFNTEKWVSFALMTFMLVLITFNLLGSLSMLVLEKKRDIGLLDAFGMTGYSIRRIFFNEGVMIALAGCLLGIALGVAGVEAQTHFGLIRTNALFAAAYPVELRVGDIALVLGLFLALGVSGAIYPAWKSALLKQRRAI